MKTTKVNQAALLARIKRALSHRGQRLYRSQSMAMEANFGEWYISTEDRQRVVKANVKPEELARELGLLQSWERVA